MNTRKSKTTLPARKAGGRRTKAKRPSASRREVKVYGVHAVQAVWRNRRDSIIRAYVVKERLKEFADLLKWCAGNKKAYHVVTTTELNNIAEATHHQGICLLAVERPRIEFMSWSRRLAEEAPKRAIFLFLDGVENPHNIGSILRVCAHFGVQYVLGTKASLPKMSPSAYRVAEGGSEFVEFVEVENGVQSLKKLRELGFQAVATSGHAKASLYAHVFSPRTVLILGAEVEGVSQDILKNGCDTTLSITGTGHVESINVAIACGVVLSEYRRQIKYHSTP